MESSLLTPYKISKSSDWDYTFVTQHGIVYHAYFVDFSNYHPSFSNVYTFNIEPEGIVNHPIDYKIALTVVDILKKFFEVKEHAMIMICDNLDGKEEKRKILFQRWFNRHNDGSIIKFDASAETDDYTLYVSLYLKRDNPNATELIKSFYELIGNDMYPM